MISVRIDRETVNKAVFEIREQAKQAEPVEAVVASTDLDFLRGFMTAHGSSGAVIDRDDSRVLFLCESRPLTPEEAASVQADFGPGECLGTFKMLSYSVPLVVQS